jgi:hypothetical protein
VEENVGSTSRSYAGFIKSLFSSSGTTNTAAASSSTSTGLAQSSTMVPTEKLTELDVKGIKGNNELHQIRKTHSLMDINMFL